MAKGVHHACEVKLLFEAEKIFRFTSFQVD